MNDHYAFIEAEKASFPIVRGCRLLEVSASGFYAWRQRPLSATATRRAQIAGAAAGAHEESDGIFGYRRVHRELVEAGTVVSAHLVRRVMREHDLAGAQPRAYRVTTIQDPDAVPAPICSNATSRAASPVLGLWVTSPTSVPGPAGPTWPS